MVVESSNNGSAQTADEKGLCYACCSSLADITVTYLLGLAVTHTHTRLFYGSLYFVRNNPGEPLPEETFTHYTFCGHQSSHICFLHLL